MATELIGTATSATSFHSIQDAQSGINVESISFSTEPEFRENLLSISGHIAGQAVGDTMTNLTISGEVTRAAGALTGLLDIDFFTTPSITVTNSGGVESASAEYVLQSAEVSQTRGSFETCTLNFTSYANLDVAAHTP